MSDYREHLTIVDTDGSPHVIPTSYFDGVSRGTESIEMLGMKEKILPVIIGEWMQMLRDRVG